MILHSCIFEMFEIDLKGGIFERESNRPSSKSKYSHPRLMPRAGASEDESGGDKFENLQFQKDVKSGRINPKITSDSFMKFADYGLAFSAGFAPASGIIFKNYPLAKGV